MARSRCCLHDSRCRGAASQSTHPRPRHANVRTCTYSSRSPRWHRKGLLDGSQWPFDLSRRRMTARWRGARHTHTHTRAPGSKQMSGQRIWPSPTSLFGAIPRGGGGADRLRCLRSPTVASARQCNVRNRHIITSARACRHDHRSSAQARRHAGPALKLACDRFLHERRTHRA